METEPKNHAFDFVEESVRRASVSISPIWVTDWKENKHFVVGTGFILVHKGRFYFVTAFHVLDSILKNKQIRITLFGRQADLHGLYFASCDKSDIAVTFLPAEWLSANRMQFLFAPSSEPLSREYEGTEDYVMAGFPASVNKFDVRWPSDSFQTKMMMVWVRENEFSATTTKIINPLNFQYEHKIRTGKLLPALQGLSGGPLYQVMRRDIKKDGKLIGLGINPVGVLCEWHKKERTVVAVRISAVVKLIDESEMIWKLAGPFHARISKSTKIWTFDESFPPFPL